MAVLDDALVAGGALVDLAQSLSDQDPSGPDVEVDLPRGASTAPALRAALDRVRVGDHALSNDGGVELVLGHIRSAERETGRLRGRSRIELMAALGEAYQLAGWMSFDRGDGARAESLLEAARERAQQADDRALVAFVLGPNMAFASTYGGDPELGVERAYGALAWARRCGNRRLVAFSMAIAARAHARLGEGKLCLELLDRACGELDGHDGAAVDPGWLAVFDHGALEGHRGSCLLDLGLPDRAVDPLEHQESVTPDCFIRNRVIWRLDRAEAHIKLGEVGVACAEINTASALSRRTAAAALPSRVLRRFQAAGTRLRAWETIPAVRDTRGELRMMLAAQRGERVMG